MNEFRYDLEALVYLKKKDKKLAQIINQIGPIKRNINPDLFESLVSSIVAQQISGKAFETVYERLKQKTNITPKDILSLTTEDIQTCGMSLKKVSYIQGAATYFSNVDIDFLRHLDDETLINHLVELHGVGRWSAEMLLIFSLNRMNVLSKKDLAIRRGISMLYHHRQITDDLLEKYHKPNSPYASIASLYLWEISSGRYGHVDHQK
jgi:DNA-3-methyladenine glycosylase II